MTDGSRGGDESERQRLQVFFFILYIYTYICAHKRNRESSQRVGLKPHEERTEAYREEGTML